MILALRRGCLHLHLPLSAKITGCKFEFRNLLPLGIPTFFSTRSLLFPHHIVPNQNYSTLQSSVSPPKQQEEVETVFSDIVKERVADAASRKFLAEVKNTLVAAAGTEELESILSQKASFLLKPELWLLLLDILRNGSKPKLALKVFEWKKKQPHASFCPQEYALAIHLAGKLGEIQTVKNLYDEMPTRGIRRTIQVENAYMFAHAYDSGHCDFTEALKVFQRLREGTDSNLTPDLVSYNVALSCYSKMRHLQHLEKTFEEMLDAGFSPSVETYNCLMLAYCRLGIWWRMEEVFCMMRDASHKPNALTFSTLIRGYAAANLLDRMENVYIEMLRRNLPLRAATAEAMIAVYKKAGEFTKMENILFSIKAKRFVSGMSKLMVRSHACNGRLSTIEEFVDEAMRNTSVPFSPGLATIIIKAYHKKCEHEKIETFLDKAEQCGWNFTNSNYNTLIYLYGKGGLYDKMEYYFQRMISSKCPPNLRTFRILFKSYQQGGLKNAAEEVLSRMWTFGFNDIQGVTGKAIN